MPQPTAIDAARKFREQLAKNEAQSAERMARLYNQIYRDLQDQINGLAVEIANAGGKIDNAQMIKLARSKALLEQVKAQVTRFGGTVQNEVTLVQSQAIQAGINDGLKLIELSLPQLPPEMARLVSASFTRLPADAVEAAAGLVGTDSPLVARLQEGYGEYVAQQVADVLPRGIAIGQGPATIAARLQRNLLDGLGSGLTSALTTIRTAQIKSYQMANHATYLANQNVVKGWVWHSALDANTCMSCIAQHGSVHPVEETLNDHHNGRCAPIPLTVSYQELGIDLPEVRQPMVSGEEWFKKQSEALQREMMGGPMFDAYKAGQVGFGDLSRKYDDPVYGELLRQASLKDILGEKAKGYYQQ